MTVSIRNKLAGFALFVLFALILEVVNFNLLGFGILPVHFAIDFGFLLMMAAFFLFIPSTAVQFAFELVFLVLTACISVTNANLQAITGEIFMWEMLALVGAAEEALGETTLLNFSALFIYVPILLAYVIIRIVFAIVLRVPKKVEPPMKRKLAWRSFLVTLVLATVCYCTGFFIKDLAYYALAEEVEGSTEAEIFLSDAYLFETLHQGDESIKQFGAITYYMKTMYYYIGLEGDAAMSESLLDDYFAAGAARVDNDYTGLSEGNNLIVILMESFEYFAIDALLTPTLYQLFYEDGVLLSNYYAKAKTDAAEATSIFGSYPAFGSLFYNYFDDAFPHTLPNLLRSETPITAIRSFHNNTGEFYNRTIAHVNFGFDEHVDGAMMELTDYTFWIRSDYEMLVDQADAMIPEGDEKFFTYITSFVMHGGYNRRKMFNETYRYFEEIGYHDDDEYFDGMIQTYMAAAIDFDMAMAVLMDRLAATNHLDDTTIVMFADHHAYYYGLTYHMHGLDPSIPDISKVYNLPAVIYDTKLKALRAEKGFDQIGKFVTTADLVPTILNLFGVDYHPDWYVGYDIFSPYESVIVSKQGGIFNDHYYTSDGETVLWAAPEATTPDWVLFQANAAATINKTNHLNLVYSIDYWGLKENEGE